MLLNFNTLFFIIDDNPMGKIILEKAKKKKFYVFLNIFLQTLYLIFISKYIFTEFLAISSNFPICVNSIKK